MGSMLAFVLAAQTGVVIDVTHGPIATTTVAVTVALDPEGRVVSCRSASAVGGACAGFPRGAWSPRRSAGTGGRSRGS